VREGIPVGVITLWKNKVAPFTEAADRSGHDLRGSSGDRDRERPAVRGLRQRTGDLSEALERQTATSEVLQVISTSPGELETVFQSMLEHATRICEAKFTALWAFEDGAARIISSLGIPPKFAAFLQRGAHRPGPLNPLSRLVETRQVVHVHDYRADQSYLAGDRLAVSGVNWAASGRC
jgi:hypothetical protein